MHEKSLVSNSTQLAKRLKSHYVKRNLIWSMIQKQSNGNERNLLLRKTKRSILKLIPRFEHLVKWNGFQGNTTTKTAPCCHTTFQKGEQRLPQTNDFQKRKRKSPKTSPTKQISRFCSEKATRNAELLFPRGAWTQLPAGSSQALDYGLSYFLAFRGSLASLWGIQSCFQGLNPRAVLLSTLNLLVFLGQTFKLH